MEEHIVFSRWFNDLFGIPMTAEIFCNYSVWRQRVLLIRGRLMWMSNVNKFAIRNCNHLMLERTGKWLGHKAVSGWTNTNTKGSRVLHVQNHHTIFPSYTSSLSLSLPCFPPCVCHRHHPLLWRWACCISDRPKPSGPSPPSASDAVNTAMGSSRESPSALFGRAVQVRLALAGNKALIFFCFACFPTAWFISERSMSGIRERS